MSDATAKVGTLRFDSLDVVIYGADLSQAHTGVAVYLRSLLRALQKEPVTLRWAIALPESQQHIATEFPAQHRLIVPGNDSRGYLWNEIAWQTRIARWVKRHAPQAVFHTPFHFWSPIAPRRMLMTAHDCIEMRVPEVQQVGRVRRLHRSLCWRMVRHASGVVAVSEWTRQELIALARVPQERIAVVYNWPGAGYAGRQSPDQIAGMRNAYGLPPRYVAYLGGFRSYKNVETLIAAWRIARAKGCPALVLAGALPPKNAGIFYTDVRRAVERAGSQENEIILPGAIKDEDLPLFYAGASLFVSPSHYEGFGYPAVEATACGTPVLVADRSAYREIFPERLRFPSNDPERLAGQMLAALGDPRGFVHLLDERFTEDHGKQRYEDLFRQLLQVK